MGVIEQGKKRWKLSKLSARSEKLLIDPWDVDYHLHEIERLLVDQELNALAIRQNLKCIQKLVTAKKKAKKAKRHD